MSNAPTQRAQPTGPAQGPDPGSAHPGCADAHRRGQDERADPGDHPGRRRRDGLLLQPLRDQGAAVRRCRRGGDGRLGQLLDELTGDIEDPAEVFACSFRLTGRLQRREPELSRVFLNNVLRLLIPSTRRSDSACEDTSIAHAPQPSSTISTQQRLHVRCLRRRARRFADDVADAVGHRAEQAAPDAGRLENRRDEIRRRGLAVGAGDADHPHLAARDRGRTRRRATASASRASSTIAHGT